jgi:zinc-ribbon domain
MASTPAFCSACGASLLPGARFCTRCGRPVQAEEPVAPVQAEGMTAPVQAEGMTAPVQAEETMAGEVVGVPPPPSRTIVVEGPPPPMAPAATLQPAAVLPSTYPSVAPPAYPSVAPPAYPSVAPPAYPSMAAPAYPSIAPVAVMPARKGMGTGARIAIGLAIAVVALGGATILLIRIISSPTNPATNTISYAVEFDNDYLAMLTADNAGVVQENSTTLATSVAGLKARIAARKTFDSQVARISFPASASADVKQLETTDAAVEQILTKLLADEGNAKAYNADIAAEQPLRAAFDAAVTKLLKD